MATAPTAEAARPRSATSIMDTDRDIDEVPERALFADLGWALYKSGTPSE